jgi:hypothetical protein
LRANAHPFAERLPEELNRQVGIGIREAAEQGLGVTLAMAPLIKARPGFGKKLVAPFDFDTTPPRRFI